MLEPTPMNQLKLIDGFEIRNRICELEKLQAENNRDASNLAIRLALVNRSLHRTGQELIKYRTLQHASDEALK